MNRQHMDCKIIGIIDNIIFWTVGIWLIVLTSPITLCIILYKWNKSGDFDRSICYSSEEIYEPYKNGYYVSKDGVTETYNTDCGAIQICTPAPKSKFIEFLDKHRILSTTRDYLTSDYKWHRPHDVIVDGVRYLVAGVSYPQYNFSSTKFRQDKISVHPYREKTITIDNFKQYQYVDCKLSWKLIQCIFDTMKDLIQGLLLWDTKIYNLYKLFWSKYRRNWTWCPINNGILDEFKDIRECINKTDYDKLDNETIEICNQMTSKNRDVLEKAFERISITWSAKTPSKLSKWFTVNAMLKFNYQNV